MAERAVVVVERVAAVDRLGVGRQRRLLWNRQVTLRRLGQGRRAVQGEDEQRARLFVPGAAADHRGDVLGVVDLVADDRR